MTDNPYESPALSQTVREMTAEPARNDTRMLNSWLVSLAVAVTGFSTFGIWSAARILEDYVEIEMPDVFSRGIGWCVGGAWVVAFVATFALSGAHWLRSLAFVGIAAYFAAVIALVLAFLNGIWSPTWSLS